MDNIEKENVDEEEGEELEKMRLDGFGALKGIGRLTRKDKEEMWGDFGERYLD